MSINDKFDKWHSENSKIFGKDFLFLPKFKPIDSVEFVSMNHHGLDSVLGGGIPKGRMIEIFGPESSGKTTICLEAVVQFQKSSDKMVGFVDAEHALDPKYAGDIGIDMNRMSISQPESGENSLAITESMIKSPEIFSLVVVDSVDALVPRAQIDGELGDANMANTAKLMSQATRRLKSLCSEYGVPVLFTNQIRHKIGVFFGSPEFTSGGNALKFYASQRIDIRKIDAIKGKGDRFLGIKSRVKVVKNKVAPPLGVVVIDILFGKGIDRDSSKLDHLMDTGKVNMRGSNFYISNDNPDPSLKGKLIGQGRQKTIAWLKENKEAKI